MWSAEADYRSIHKVMHSFEQALQPAEFTHCFLMGDPPNDFILQNAFSLYSSKKHTKKRVSRFFLKRRYSKIINENKPELIVIDGLGMARLLLPILPKHPEVRALVFIHGPTKVTKNDRKIFESTSVENVRGVAVSNVLTDQLREQLPNTPVYSLPTLLMLPTNEINCEPKKGTATLTLGAVGRLVKGKNFHLLIDVIKDLKKIYDNVELKIAGDGEQREHLQKKIDDYELQKHIRLLGHIEDIESFYHQIDVLLVPSLREGQGLVVQEALHYDKPIICSDIAVFKEQLGDTGIYCPSDNVEQWLAACKKVIAAEQRENILIEQKKYSKQYNSADLYHKRCLAICQFPLS